MAGPGDIIVRIGAVADRSVDTVFSSIKEKSERAFGATRRENQRTTKEHKQNSDQVVFTEKEQARFVIAETRRAAAARIAIERDRFRENSRLARQLLAEEAKAERLSTALAAKASRSKLTQRQKDQREEEKNERAHQATLSRMAVNAAREQNRLKRAAAREAAKEAFRSEREIDRFATRTSHRATRFFFPRPEGALGYGKRIAGDLMRGAGVDFSLGGGVARARERDKAAIALANQGWMPGQKAEDKITSTAIRGTSSAIAGKFAVNELDVIEGMSKFTDVTGDLKTAQASMESIVLLAKASGTEIQDAASAAADMSMQLGNIPNKAGVLAKLMGVAAMGGKQGAVEIKDLAKYVPQIAALASTLTGDRATNIGKLLAITQTARQYGGAGNAAIATTATAGLINTLQTPARVKQFEAHFQKATGGKGSVYNEQGQLRDITDILIDSIKSAGTGKYRQVEFKKMWANVKGGKAAQGFMTLYDEAEELAKKDKSKKYVQGVAGEAAVRGQFEKFEKGISREDQLKLAGEAMKSIESQAQAFQTQLDKVTEELAGRLLPTFKQLAPVALDVASRFSQLVSWAASNPWKAVFAGLGISVSRAIVESLGRMALERVLTNAGGPVGAMTTVGKGAAGMSALAIGAATFAITTAVLNAANVSMQEDKQARSTSYNETFKEFSRDYGEAKTPEERAKVIELAKKRVELTHESRGAILNTLSPDADKEATLRAIAGFVKEASTGEKPWTPGDLAPAQGKQPATAEEVGRNVAMALKGQQLEVKVVNVEEMSKPFVAPIPGMMPGIPSFPQN